MPAVLACTESVVRTHHDENIVDDDDERLSSEWSPPGTACSGFSDARGRGPTASLGANESNLNVELSEEMGERGARRSLRLSNLLPPAVGGRYTSAVILPATSECVHGVQFTPLTLTSGCTADAAAAARSCCEAPAHSQPLSAASVSTAATESGRPTPSVVRKKKFHGAIRATAMSSRSLVDSQEANFLRSLISVTYT